MVVGAGAGAGRNVFRQPSALEKNHTIAMNYQLVEYDWGDLKLGTLVPCLL